MPKENNNEEIENIDKNIAQSTKISETSIEESLENINSRLYSNKVWNDTAPSLKKMSLLQGIPFTIYSYAAGIFRSNNRFSLFGIIDFFTYISRLNILGSLNIRPDITFTFLNEKKILDGYLATYNNGIFGSALNIFMNNFDFNTMDEIIDKDSDTIIKENDSSYDISYNIISKISTNSMSSPNYFKLNKNEDNILLDEKKLKDYKSIIYGGIDYEQIAVILNNISSFPNIEEKGIDSFTFDKYIFHYFIELNFESIEKICNIMYDTFNSSVLSDLSLNMDEEEQYSSFQGIYGPPIYETQYSNLINNKFEYHNAIMRNRIYRNYDVSLNYNDLFKFLFKDIYNCEYNYGQIYFFKKHKKIKYIYLPHNISISDTSTDDEKTTFQSNIGQGSLDNKFIQIYNYKYDDDKKNSSEPEFSIVLMPVKTIESDMVNGNIGTFTYQFLLEKPFRNIEVSELSYSHNNNYKYLSKNSINKFKYMLYNIIWI